MLASPVFAAHMLSSRLPFDLRSDYGGHPLPAGEQSVKLLYEHLQFYVDKMKSDLKNIGEWDRSSQHGCVISSSIFCAACSLSVYSFRIGSVASRDSIILRRLGAGCDCARPVACLC